MSLTEQTSQRRVSYGRIAAFCIALFFAAMLDGLIAGLRHPVNTLDMVRGTSEKIDGRMPGNFQDTGDLAYTSTSGSINVSFDGVHSGFWMGGLMWRGTVTIRPDASPGHYSLTVGPRGEEVDQRLQTVFNINIYKDALSYRQDAKSLIRKHVGFSPWLLAVIFLVPGCAAFGFVFYLSQRMEKLLAQEGKAEVYMLKKGETSYEFAFGLGRLHGVHPGSRLTLCDPEGRPVGSAQVIKSAENDSLAIADLNSMIEPGFIVRLDH